MVLSSAAVALLVLSRLRFDRLTIAIVLAGTALYGDYLTYTSVSERDIDAFSQIQYMRAIAQQWSVPDVSACGACGHPPAYYALAAVWSKVVLAGGWMPFELGLQWLSLLLFIGFVVFALLAIRSLDVAPATLWLAAALVVFWPSSIINSVRVHNDALAAPLMLAAITFTARWDGQQRTRDFWAALTAAALAILTKASGHAVAATLVLFTAWRLCTTKPSRSTVAQAAIALLVLSAVALLAVLPRTDRNPRTLCQKVLGHACDGRYVPPVPDTPGRFIYFDLPDFVRRMDSLPDDPRRDYFLNRLTKSSLLGVSPLGPEFQGTRHEVLALLMRVLLLAMVTVCLGGALFMRQVPWRRYRVYVGAAIIMFTFLLAFRIRAPNEFHEDFRHIFPALVPFCVGYAVIVDRARRVSRVLYWAGVTVALLMVGSSVAFFVRMP